MTEALNLLEVENVAVRRGERRLFTNLSFALRASELALVVGPNGSGKTTLLRVLAGLAPCADGRVAWLGRAVDRLLPEQRLDLAYQGHLDGLKKDLSVRENVEFYARLRGRRRDCGALLAELSLGGVADRHVRVLSAGQRRRAALAVLKAQAARLWILDEPMTNLDSEGRRLIRGWIDRHLNANGVAVIATHQPDELAASGALMVEL